MRCNNKNEKKTILQKKLEFTLLVVVFKLICLLSAHLPIKSVFFLYI